MNKPTTFNKQQGSALIVSLSILLVLTVLGVSSMRTISLEEKMAGNSRDYQVAFESAEAALRQAEIYLDGVANLADFSANGGIGGYYLASGNNPEAWTIENNWTTAHALSVTDYDGNNEVSTQPRYIIQVVQTTLGVGSNPNIGNPTGTLPVREVNVFQVTARGFGVSPNSRVMLQTYYGVL